MTVFTFIEGIGNHNYNSDLISLVMSTIPYHEEEALALLAYILDWILITFTPQ